MPTVTRADLDRVIKRLNEENSLAIRVEKYASGYRIWSEARQRYIGPHGSKNKIFDILVSIEEFLEAVEVVKNRSQE